MTGCKIKRRPLLHFSTKRSPKLGTSNKGPKGRLVGRTPLAGQKGVNVAFKKLVHKILEKIKHECYFRWLVKMNGDPARRN